MTLSITTPSVMGLNAGVGYSGNKLSRKIPQQYGSYCLAYMLNIVTLNDSESFNVTILSVQCWNNIKHLILRKYYTLNIGTRLNI
jgi:hypothetical protein